MLATLRTRLSRLPLLGGLAAELAFFLALTVVPFLGLAIAVVGRALPVDLSPSLREVLEGILPAEAAIDPDQVLAWARNAASGGWFGLSLVVAAATCFRFLLACVRAVDAVVAGERVRHRPFRSLLSAIGLFGVWMGALVATTALLFVAPAIDAALVTLPQFAELSVAAFAALRVVLVAGVLFASILATYHFSPGVAVPSSRAVQAAALATLGWLGLGQAFSRLVPAFFLGVQPFGSLGSVVLFLLWAYLAAWVLLAAAILLVRPGAR